MDQNSRNPKGRYPLCKPSVGGVACERCGLELRDQRPCPAVDPNERWGPDYDRSFSNEKWHNVKRSMLKTNDNT